ncbi:MAG: ABC transporter ATP-binding protein [Bacillota bacterium]|nr:ABC transporter ATP-binding protein [Bacillota bacterium]
MIPILEIEELSVSFTQYERGLRKRQLSVIRDLSLTIGRGQVVAVVGASGSGKSLLAHGILGLLPYNSHMEGTIRYKGQPLTPERAKALRGRELVLVPQGVTYLDPLMQVGAQIRRGRKDEASRKNCRRVLDRYGLAPETERLYPFELSGGMARRVLISTAVLERPQLVIADEPTPGLDAGAAGRILGHFREIADEGAGVLFITHDLELALTVADRVAVFYAGETMEELPAANFEEADRLRHPYTRALWHAMPAHGFAALPGSQPLAGEAEGCLFAPRCPRCRESCREAGSIPLRRTEDGTVRCLYPQEGGKDL